MPIFTDSCWNMRPSRPAVSRSTISRRVCDAAPRPARRLDHDDERIAEDRHQGEGSGPPAVARRPRAALAGARLPRRLSRAAVADPAGLQRTHPEPERRHRPAADGRQLRAADLQSRLSPRRDDDLACRLLHLAVHLAARRSAGDGDALRPAARHPDHHDPRRGAAGGERDRAHLWLGARAGQQQHRRPQLDPGRDGRRADAGQGALHRVGDRDRLGPCLPAADGAAALGVAQPHQPLAERGSAHAGGACVARLPAHHPAALVLVGAPLLVAVALSFAGATPALSPPIGFTTSWYEGVIADEEFQHAFIVSVTLALAATAASFVLGVPAAYALNRWPVPGARAVEAMLLSPFILPILITGLALLQLMAAIRMRH